MKRIAWIIPFILYLFFMSTPAVGSENAAGISACLKPVSDTTDDRANQLQSYLEYQKSPLAKYASVFVEKADEYGLPDWRLVPAITGVESTFGKAIPEDSYNAYGWNNGNYKFTSWENSIEHVTKILKTKYYDRGLESIEDIARVYAPPSQTWARNVRYFINSISDFYPRDPENLALAK